MAFVKCPGCGKSISDHAPTCSHCGRGKAAPEPTKEQPPPIPAAPEPQPAPPVQPSGSGLKKCSDCGHDVSPKADKCPHCGRPLRKKTGCLAWGAAIFFGLMFISVIGRVIHSPSSAPGVLEDPDMMAYIRCKRAVEEKLKAPATAKFLEHSRSSIKRVAGDERGDMYEVVSYVDSQNSFGAMLRTSFTCQIVHAKANDQWVIAEIKY